MDEEDGITLSNTNNAKENITPATSDVLGCSECNKIKN